MSEKLFDDIHQKVHDFYERSRDELVKNYPGLRLDLLKSAINDYLPLMAIKSPYLFDHYFVSHKNHPLKTFFKKLNEGVPLEYITGKAYFYHSAFEVNADVLIPRSETEILIEKAVEYLHSIQGCHLPKVIDIGTGSGAIIMSVMQDYDRPIKAFATDISEKALVVAQRNYFNLRFTINPDCELDFVKTDRLQNIDEKFHLIVSNPPYIKREKDADLVHAQVYKYEPHQALFLNDDDYEKWFDQFFKQVYDRLLSDGMFIMEGHENHLRDLKKLAQDIGLKKVEVLQDYTQRDRFLVARKD